MEQRYQKVFSLTENIYAVGCPVIIAAGALQRDTITGSVIAQLKFLNISSQEIKSIKVAITPMDSANRTLSPAIEFDYLDLEASAEKNNFFGSRQALILPDNTTRSFAVNVEECVFAQGTVWQRGELEFAPIAEPVLIQKIVGQEHELEYYRKTLGERAKYLYEDFGEYFRCSCGAINSGTVHKCRECGCSVDLQKSNDLDAIRKEAKLKHEAEIAEKERQQIEKELLKKKAKIYAIFLSCAVAVITVLGLLIFKVILPPANYNSAVKLLENGDVIGAYEKFVELGEYKDSEFRAEEIYEKYCVAMIKKGQAPYNSLFIGEYEQDANLDNGTEKVEWVVAKGEGNKALLVSWYVLDAKAFHDSRQDITWAQCSLRKWLNSDFYNAVFSEQEKLAIVKAEIETEGSYNTTQDYVFLPAASDGFEGVIAATAAAKQTGKFYYYDGGGASWWLRTPSTRSGSAMVVNAYGELYNIGVMVTSETVGVRPAIWVDLDVLQDII